MSQSSTVTCSDVLDYSGEEDVGNVYELVFRANTPPITGFDPQCASELSNSLELLSLSRNHFKTLTTLSPLSNLIELNVNFNAIGPTLTTSTDRPLSPFPCLKKLYLSNNGLESIVEFSQLFPNLEHCCLFRNKLYDLNDALSNLRALKHLVGLDLAGNPCTFDNNEYKHTTVLRLKKLQLLDDDRVEALDRQLAELYFSNQQKQKHTEQDRLREGQGSGLVSRVTSTSSASSTSSTSSTSSSTALSRPSTAPSGGRKNKNKRLFRSDFLNNHPIMLEYVARGLIKEEEEEAEAGKKEQMEGKRRDGHKSKPPPKNRKRGRRSFVERLRRATSVGEEEEEDEEDEEEEEEDVGEKYCTQFRQVKEFGWKYVRGDFQGYGKDGLFRTFDGAYLRPGLEKPTGKEVSEAQQH